MAGVPKRMRAVRLTKLVESQEERALRESLRVEEVDVPVPKHGQVLVKVEFSTINPSDLGYLRGEYGRKTTTPCGAGFEGSGRVVATGGGFLGWYLKGKRVAFYGEAEVWAEYAICQATNVIPLPDTVPLEKAAGTLVNPVTVLAMVEIAKQAGQRAIIHTAAASSLGRMLIRYGKKEGVAIICVVRKEEQEEICRTAGADPACVFNSTKPNFEADLKACCAKYQCSLAFDAVCGPLTQSVAAALVEGGRVLVYGCLSGQPAQASFKELIFERKRIEGFWVTDHLRQKNFLSLMNWTSTITSLLTSDLSTDISATFELDQICDAIVHYVRNMSAGKVLLKCGHQGAAGAPASPAS